MRVYESPTDPGAIGAGNVWRRPINASQWEELLRNAANTGWLTAVADTGTVVADEDTITGTGSVSDPLTVSAIDGGAL